MPCELVITSCKTTEGRWWGYRISDKPINLVFLGCGSAARLHSKTLSHFKNRVRCYYASREIANAEEFNRRFQGAGAFGSYSEAVRSEEIDVAFVTTPPAFHLDLTLEACRGGKHCIVEKPPFLKSEDFDLVRQVETETGRRVFVAENYFYKPLRTRLRSVIESRVIGEILFVHVNALKMQTATDWRVDPTLSGGGALFEGGIHWINLISNLGLTIKAARGIRPNTKNSGELSCLVSLEFNEGPVGTFYYSWETPSLFRGLRLSKIYGRKGSITFESNGLFILARGVRKRLIFPGLRDIAGYRAMFQDFLSSIQHNREPKFTLDLAERDLRLLEQI